MSRIGDIHSVPISAYKQAHRLLQSFVADFRFNEEQPTEKAMLIQFIYLLAKQLEDDYCIKIREDNHITEKELNEYFNKLMDEDLF